MDVQWSAFAFASLAAAADDDEWPVLQSAEDSGLETNMWSNASPSEFLTVHALEGAKPEQMIFLSTARG